ncbi:hypothetical protein Q5H93_06165 [Hymenobacter sp. ASUV-10]|uniref:Uncharacterized protein n=1 Tax=Hymenobacter aranciens TaxID=3063996 RepID=A0ABT9B7W0_9BACT|nr:hypothetical protein [Hymenobacter sp. ASUV-10]MDO7874310.1 hypothetical protein [Hymenobacter sp. ASUV-10]
MSYSSPITTNPHGVTIRLTDGQYHLHYLLSASDDVELTIDVPTTHLNGFLQRHRLRSLHDVDCITLLAEVGR